MNTLINIFETLYPSKGYIQMNKYFKKRGINMLDHVKDAGIHNQQKLSYLFQEAAKHPMQLEGQEEGVYKFLNDKKRNLDTILVLPDTHFPFTKKGFFDWVQRLDDEYKPHTIIHIGDVVDIHYSSFHDSEIDAMNADEEFQTAQKSLRKLQEIFPLMHITLGNHDAIPKRKQKSAGLSKYWLKSYAEATKTYGWDWGIDIKMEKPKVYFCHGLGGKANRHKVALQSGYSVVQGHHHSDSFIELFGRLTGDKYGFAAQIGAIMDNDSYAARYGKAGVKKGVLIIKNGKPILEPFIA
jgi:predicted phosphodiesterase